MQDDRNDEAPDLGPGQPTDSTPGDPASGEHGHAQRRRMKELAKGAAYFAGWTVFIGGSAVAVTALIDPHARQQLRGLGRLKTLPAPAPSEVAQLPATMPLREMAEEAAPQLREVADVIGDQACEGSVLVSGYVTRAGKVVRAFFRPAITRDGKRLTVDEVLDLLGGGSGALPAN